MGSSNPVLKRYVRSIRKTLTCSGKMKKSIISQVNESIEYYLLQNPAADLEAVQSYFGTPQEIAANCIDGQDTFVQLKKIRTKKRIFSITAGVMAAFFLIGAGFIAWDTVHSRIIHEHSTGYITIDTCQNN